MSVYGTRLYYQEAGSGPPVILLAGLGADSSIWSFNIGPLSAQYRVIALDQVGFGKSDKPHIAYRVATNVAYLKHFMKALKIRHASLVGNSLGGWTAAAFALAHPDMVDRLVLTDASGFAVDPRQASATTLGDLTPTTREGVRRMLATLYYNKRIFTSDQVVDQVYDGIRAGGDRYPLRRFAVSLAQNKDVLDSRVAAIRKPTLIIWGQQDQVVPLSFAQRFHQEIPGSRLLVMPDCGHVPEVEMSTWFNDAVARFLEPTTPLR